jgi:hypothetical protein
MPGTTSLKGLPARSIRVTRPVIVPSVQPYADDLAVAEQAMEPQPTSAAVPGGRERQHDGSPVAAAISALELASSTGDAMAVPVFQHALNGLNALRDRALQHDRRLNDDERAPTGDDYNDLFAMTGLRSAA